LATTAVPWFVALIIRQDWRKKYKRWVALLVSVALGALQWYLQSWATGNTQWAGLAISGPIIFALAHASYIKYWKGKLGVAEEFDFIGRLTGWKV
jgi:hypothetical protein